MELDLMFVKKKYTELMDELKKVIVGQEQFLSHLAAALFTGGHVLMEGFPFSLSSAIVWLQILKLFKIQIRTGSCSTPCYSLPGRK